MKRSIISACVLGLLSMVSCEKNTQVKEGVNTSLASVNTNAKKKITAEEFIKKAYMGNMAETKLGEVASKKASAKEVKQFGQMMIDHHGTANQDLKTIAKQQNVMLSDELSSDMKNKMKELQSKSGKDFDKLYMDQMVKEHKKAIDMYESAMNDIQDASLKEYISSTLPVIEEHYQKAQDIKKSLAPKTSSK